MSEKNAKIKWVNKYSNETGFVKALNDEKNDFINATEEEAGTFPEKEAMEIIDILKAAQEQNLYIAVRLAKTKEEKPAKTVKSAAKTAKTAKTTKASKTATKRTAKPAAKKPVAKKETVKAEPIEAPAEAKAENK